MACLSFHKVCKIEEIPPGERLFVEMDDKPIVILNIDDGFFAIDDVCTHDDGPLGDGDIEDVQIICPRHGARFDLRTGEVISLPAVSGVSTYPTRVVEGILEIGIEA